MLDESVKKSPVESVPYDIWQEIFFYLKSEDFGSLSAVNHFFYSNIDKFFLNKYLGYVKNELGMSFVSDSDIAFGLEKGEGKIIFFILKFLENSFILAKNYRVGCAENYDKLGVILDFLKKKTDLGNPIAGYYYAALLISLISDFQVRNKKNGTIKYFFNGAAVSADECISAMESPWFKQAIEDCPQILLKIAPKNPAAYFLILELLTNKVHLNNFPNLITILTETPAVYLQKGLEGLTKQGYSIDTSTKNVAQSFFRVHDDLGSMIKFQRNSWRVLGFILNIAKLPDSETKKILGYLSEKNILEIIKALNSNKKNQVNDVIRILFSLSSVTLFNLIEGNVLALDKIARFLQRNNKNLSIFLGKLPTYIKMYPTVPISDIHNKFVNAAMTVQHVFAPSNKNLPEQVARTLTFFSIDAILQIPNINYLFTCLCLAWNDADLKEFAEEFEELVKNPDKREFCKLCNFSVILLICSVDDVLQSHHYEDLIPSYSVFKHVFTKYCQNYPGLMQEEKIYTYQLLVLKSSKHLLKLCQIKPHDNGAKNPTSFNQARQTLKRSRGDESDDGTQEEPTNINPKASRNF